MKLSNSTPKYQATVIIPTFNRAHYLPDAISSILQQSIDTWQLIVVDDGSTDNTASLMMDYTDRYSNILYLKRSSEMKKGANTCRNLGYQAAEGKYIKWLDSDDILHHDILRLQIHELEKNAACDVCFSQFGYFEKTGDQIVHVERFWSKMLTSDQPVHDYVKDKLKWTSAAGLWRKDRLGAEPFKEGLMNSQEWLMCLKYLISDIKFTTVPIIGGYVRIHDDRMSSERNKKAKYYYNQCYSRYLAIGYLANSSHNHFLLKWHLFKFLCWNYIFIVYNKGFILSIKCFKWLPSLLWYFFKPVKTKQTKG